MQITNYDSFLAHTDNIKHVCKIIKILSDSSGFKTKSKYIFDGAAIGQYLGGVDKRNQDGDTRGFVNETCIVKYNNFEFFWIKKDNLYRPHIYINLKYIPIINLHVHSKELNKFMGNNPLENKLIKFQDQS